MSGAEVDSANTGEGVGGEAALRASRSSEIAPDSFWAASEGRLQLGILCAQCAPLLSEEMIILFNHIVLLLFH